MGTCTLPMPTRDFIRRFDRGRQPACLRPSNMATHFAGWPEAWTVQSLRRRWGQNTFNVYMRIGSTQEFDMQLNEFVDYMRLNVDADPLYLFEAKIPQALLELINVPAMFEDNLLADLDDPAFRGRQWLLMGSARSGLSLHVDPFGCSAWNALLQGRKRWVFFRPGCVPPGVLIRKGQVDGVIEYESPTPWSWFREVLPSLPPQCRPVEVIQEAGDIIWIPHGWWHSVINLTETVAFTQNIINARNVREATRQLQPFEPAFARKLQQAMLNRHHD